MKIKFKINFKKIKLEKHILIIIIIIFITLILSLCILSLISNTETENTIIEGRLKTVEKKLKSINDFKPTPTQGNIEKISNDTSYLKKQLWIYKSKFGNPYIEPLISFVTALKNSSQKNNDAKIKENTVLTSQESFNILYDFLTSWTLFYNADKPKTLNSETAKTTFIEFLKKSGYNNENYNNALEAFKKNLQKGCFEELDLILSEDYLYNSIGFPLRISRIQCKELITKTEENVNKKLHENKILSLSQSIQLFDEFTTMPNDDQIPYIIDYLWFYQDLITKIINSKIESLPTHNKINGLKGTAIDNFTVLKYEIEVIGSISSIRKLINEIQESSINNRVYTVDFISLLKAIDNAENIETPGKRKRTLDINIIIGSSDLLKAKIKLSYYIYNKPLVTF